MKNGPNRFQLLLSEFKNLGGDTTTGEEVVTHGILGHLHGRIIGSRMRF